MFMRVIRRLDPKWVGVVGMLLLLGFYFSVLTIANSWSYAISQFEKLWYLFAPLVIGFGIQLGLFVYIKKIEHGKKIKMGAGVAASSGVSAGAMIACCLHHVADLLPLLGLSAAALFLIEFQIPFIVLGISSNVFGIMMMLVVMQEHRMFEPSRFFDFLFQLNMRKARRFVLMLGVAFTITSFVATIV